MDGTRGNGIDDLESANLPRGELSTEKSIKILGRAIVCREQRRPQRCGSESEVVGITAGDLVPETN